MIESTSVQQLIVTAVWALPLVTGLVEVVKRALGEKLPTRFVPLLSVAVGAIVGLLVIQLTVTGAVVGIVLGLGATGLWEFGKTTIAAK